MDDVATERTCPRCGAPVVGTGRGRPPVWCSPTCRTRAWETRRAAADGAGDEHQDADTGADAGRSAGPRPPTNTPPTSPAPVGGRAVPTSARSWAALLDELALQLAAGPLGRKHYDHCHLYSALQSVWSALDVAHPGGLDELQRRRR